MNATTLADVMFQAAVAVGHHAKNSPTSAIREGVIRVLGENHSEAYATYTEGRRLYGLLMGVNPSNVNAKDFHCTGPSWQMWLSNQGRAEMVMTLLFCYEYLVQEMLGDRVTNF